LAFSRSTTIPNRVPAIMDISRAGATMDRGAPHAQSLQDQDVRHGR
jgi:hypothetical protein